MRGAVRAACLAVLVACPAATASAADEADLFANGDFEDGIDGWRVLNQSGSASFTPDKKVRQSGAQSLRIERTGQGSRDFLKQSATLPAGVKEVRAVCHVKVDKGARAEVSLYFFDAQGEDVGKGQMPWVQSGATKRWEKHDETFEVPKGAVGVGVNVIVTAVGTFWLDGLRLTAKVPGGLVNGGFEQALDGWRPLEHGTGTTVAASDPAVRSGGKASARIVRSSARLFPEDGLVADVLVRGTPGKQRLRWDARTDDAARASVALQAFDEGGTCVATARAPAGAPGKKLVEGSLTLDVPATTRRLVVSLLVSGAGTAWFDEVALGPAR